MPSPKGYVRDYAQERRTAMKRGEVSSGPNGDNAKRKAARRKLEKAVGDRIKGKDVDHINMNPKDNRKSNLRVTSKSNNRSFPRSGKQYGNGKRKK